MSLDSTPAGGGCYQQHAYRDAWDHNTEGKVADVISSIRTVMHGGHTTEGNVDMVNVSYQEPLLSC
jgi:hypothetical protein